MHCKRRSEALIWKVGKFYGSKSIEIYIFDIRILYDDKKAFQYNHLFGFQKPMKVKVVK